MLVPIKAVLLTMFGAVTASSNIPPTANSDTYTLYCNSGGGFNVTANDVDPNGDPLTVISADGSGINVGYGDGAYGIVTIGTTAQTGTFYGNYTISDGQGGTSSTYITVNVIHGGPYC